MVNTITCIAPSTDNTTTSLSYGVLATDVAQVYLSPTPYNDAFEGAIDLRKFDFTHHRSAGLSLLQQDNRLILVYMVSSTPGARIAQWRTRLQGAWLLSVDGTPVTTLSDLQQTFHDLSLQQGAKCILLFAHPEISHGLSNTGIPLLRGNQISQLNIDQLTDQWTPKPTPTPVLPKAPNYNIVINGDVRNIVTKVMKLTRGKLMKQDD